MNEQYLPILNFIKNNPDRVILEPTEYANQLTFAFSKKLATFIITTQLFPAMRLHVERLEHTTVTSNQELFDYFFALLSTQQKKSFKDVWLTTSDVTDRQLLLVELSFE